MNSDSTSLDRLHDILVPPPVPWWPPAPAWYWVLGFLAIILLTLAVAGIIDWQRNKYRREALALWRRDSSALHDPPSRAQALIGLAELLKRTALTAFPRDKVASLTGAEWFRFLDRNLSKNSFASGDGQLLENVAYDSRVAASIDEAQAHRLAAAVHDWIKKHRIR